MRLTGYIDESISKKDRIFTLSAVVGINEQWKNLTSDWVRLLDEENRRLKQQGRPPLTRYHASECNALDHEFEGWSKDEQISLTKTLFRLLKKYDLGTFAYSIDLMALADEIKGGNLKEAAYSLCTNLLIFRLGKWLTEKSAGHDTLVTLVHDRCAYDSVILKQFNNLTADTNFRERKSFPSIEPMSWENCVPLQTADMMAYKSMKDAERTLAHGSMRKPLEIIISEGNMGLKTHLVTRDSLNRMGILLDALSLR